VAEEEPELSKILASYDPMIRVRIERALEQFEEWPAAKSKVATEEMLEIGTPVVPVIRFVLRHGTPAAKTSAAQVARGLGVKDLFADLQIAIQKFDRIRHLKVFFRALIELDAQGSFPILLEYLTSRRESVRYSAFQFLAPLVNESRQEALSVLLKHQREGARLYAVQLLGMIEEAPEIEKQLLESLRDRSAKVADQASRSLGKRAGDALVSDLVRATAHVDLRFASFATLTLVRMEDRLKTRLLPQSLASLALVRVRSENRFVRGVATIALANLGMDSDSEEIVKFLDQWAVPILIDTVGGGVFYPEFQAVRAMSFLKLRQLTGESLVQNPDPWRKWWIERQEGFEAVRLLRSIPENKVEKLEISFALDSYGRLPVEVVLVSRRTSSVVARYPNARILGATTATLRAWALLLKSIRFFEMEETLGEIQKRASTRRLTVRLGNLKREVVAFSLRGSALDEVEKQIHSYVNANRWQTYWDQRNYSNWDEWWTLQEPWWSQVNDPLARNRKYKVMITTSFGSLTEKQRREAAKHFDLLLTEDRELSKFGAEIMLFNLQVQKGVDEIVEHLARGLARMRNLKITREAVRVLAAYAPVSRDLMEEVFLISGGPIAVRFLQDRDPLVRAVAVESLRDVEDKEVDAVLLGASGDTAASVRQSVAYTLGHRKIQSAFPVLQRMIEDSDVGVRRAALVALGKLEMESAVPSLLKALRDEDETVRGAALTGLGHSGSENAVSTLFGVLERSESPVLREVAMLALAAIGGERVQRRARDIFEKSPQVPVRVEALALIVRMEKENGQGMLRGYLEDSRLEIRVEVALHASRLHEVSSVPVLIEGVEKGIRRLSCQEALSRLTVQEVTRRGFDRWKRWWKTASRTDPRNWLVEALAERDYPVKGLKSFFGEPSVDVDRVAPVLMSAIYDEDWYVGHNATWALRTLSGRRDLPLVERVTNSSGRDEVYESWMKWWNERMKREK
jgi:HEAT repeat protein